MDNLATPLSVKGQKRAVCVGISYKGQSCPEDGLPLSFELPEVFHDVKTIQKLLIEHYEYPAENFTILVDDGGDREPIKDNILAAMNDLVDNAQPEDSLFFFYIIVAGHGYQKKCYDGSERDGLDEFILPKDWRTPEWKPNEPSFDAENSARLLNILNQDIRKILVERLPKGCKLTKLLNALRLVVTIPNILKMERIIQLHLPIGEIFQVLRTTTATALRRSAGCPLRNEVWVIRGETIDDEEKPPDDWARVISWSACSDAQRSWSACSNAQRGIKSHIPNRSGGLMVQPSIGEQPSRTYRDILIRLG
ncbi:caspase domain-containing protein [Hysterangium stoloniferum]|nr:caspase domain-containing protein [Hysterangium stoloniferum]